MEPGVIAPVQAAWPSTPGALLVFAQVLLSWTVVQYAMPRRDEPRLLHSVADGLLISASVIILLGYDAESGWLLAITLGVAAVVLQASRVRVQRVWSAEWEIGMTVFVIAVSAALVARMNPTGPALTLIRIGAESEAIASVLILIAAVVFVARGGNIVVRGFLEKAGSLPTYRDESAPGELQWSGSIRAAALEKAVWQIDVRQGKRRKDPPSEEERRNIDIEEIGRGRLIGTLERILLLLLALGGHYTAVAFLITAKGLVRAKEFERRDYAEYFLIGTLASTALALVLGTLIRLALRVPGI